MEILFFLVCIQKPLSFNQQHTSRKYTEIFVYLKNIQKKKNFTFHELELQVTDNVLVQDFLTDIYCKFRQFLVHFKIVMSEK